MIRRGNSDRPPQLYEKETDHTSISARPKRSRIHGFQWWSACNHERLSRIFTHHLVHHRKGQPPFASFALQLDCACEHHRRPSIDLIIATVLCLKSLSSVFSRCWNWREAAKCCMQSLLLFAAVSNNNTHPRWSCRSTTSRGNSREGPIESPNANREYVYATD